MNETGQNNANNEEKNTKYKTKYEIKDTGQVHIKNLNLIQNNTFQWGTGKSNHSKQRKVKIKTNTHDNTLKEYEKEYKKELKHTKK